MESKEPFLQKPIEEYSYDMKNLFRKYLKKWYWFVISVFICVFIALIYVMVSPPVYQSTALVQIRPDRSANLSSQLSIIEGYGYINNKNTEDEMAILSSGALMLEVINALNIENSYYYKSGAKYIDLYNQSPIEIILSDNFREPNGGAVEFLIKKTRSNEYKISLKSCEMKENFTVTGLESPITTSLGVIKFIEKRDMKNYTYKIINIPKDLLAIQYIKSLKITEHSKRSHILNVSIETLSAEKSRDIINSLVASYLAQDMRHKKQNSIDAINSIDERLEIVNNELSEIEKNIELISRQSKTADREKELVEAKRLYQAREANYQFLMEKREENELRMVTDTPEIQVIEPAHTPDIPVSPKKIFSLAFAMLIGVIIPFLAIYLQDFFNNKIENKKQIHNLLRVPFLGTVKTNKALKKRTSEKEFSLSNTGEDFQTLRSNLQYALKGRKSPVISVTSLIDQEGKTYIAANLAKSLASISKKTVLLDIDMQRSDLSKQFGLSGNTKGLVDYVCNPDLEIKDILAPYNGDANLSIIPSGKLTTNTADILMSGRLDELINELKNSYEYIIIDTTAITNNADTFQLNRFADNTLFVVRQNYTTYDSIGLINEMRNSEKLTNVSAILNDTEE